MKGVFIMAKFKIGDRVRAMEDGLSRNSHIKKGMAGDVIDIRIGDVCVEFDDSIYGHSNPLGESGKPNHCWWVSNEEVTLITENKIVITTDGKETLARLYEDNKVVKSAVAKCSPDDIFDFNTGAKIAFNRLMEEKPEKKWRVVNRPAREGDYIRLKTPLVCHTFHFNKPGDIMRVARGGYCSCSVRDCDHPRPTGSSVDANYLWCYTASEYEVVEPVETPEEKPKYYNGKVICVKKTVNASAYTVGRVYEFKDGKVTIDNGVTLPSAKGITTLDEWNEDKSLYCKFIPFVE